MCDGTRCMRERVQLHQQDVQMVELALPVTFVRAGTLVSMDFVGLPQEPSFPPEERV